MFEIVGKRFFQTLRKNAEFKLGPDHPCTQAIAQAADTGAEADIELAQKQLTKLPNDVSEGLMEAAHKALREDPSALLEMWPGRGDPNRPN